MPEEAEINPDETLLEVSASWWQARRHASYIWSKNDKASLFGLRAVDEPSPAAHVAHMRDLARNFPMKPRIIMGARESLRIPLEILEARERDSESVMSEGPATEIIRAVIAELGERTSCVPKNSGEETSNDA